MITESKKATYYIATAILFVFSIILVIASIKCIKALPEDSFYGLGDIVKTVRKTYVVQIVFGIILCLATFICMFLISSSGDDDVASARAISIFMAALSLMFVIELCIIANSSGASAYGVKEGNASTILFFIALVLFIISAIFGSGMGTILPGILGVLFMLIANLVGTDFSISTNLVDIIFYVVNIGALAFYITPPED